MTLNTIQRLGAAISLLLTAAVVVAVIAPGLVISVSAARRLISIMANLDIDTIGLGSAVTIGVVLLLVLVLSSTGSKNEDTFETLRTDPPETVTETRADRVGDPIDQAIEHPDEPDAVDLQERLRTLAERRLRMYNSDEIAPPATITDGSWTDIHLAAVYLSDEVQPTTVEQLRSWLDPEAERKRRIRATIRALSQLSEDESK